MRKITLFTGKTLISIYIARISIFSSSPSFCLVKSYKSHSLQVKPTSRIQVSLHVPYLFAFWLYFPAISQCFPIFSIYFSWILCWSRKAPPGPGHTLRGWRALRGLNVPGVLKNDCGSDGEDLVGFSWEYTIFHFQKTIVERIKILSVKFKSSVESVYMSHGRNSFFTSSASSS